jgi:transaldolase
MTRLHDLYDVGGQSPWLDNLRRDWLHDGQLAQMVRDGVRGITSNPTIFAKAIEGEDDYDEQFRSLSRDHTVEEAYWELVITDILEALELLRPLHEESGGGDGFVSLEVSPALANDTKRTIESGRWLHRRVDRPNLLVKVPATPAGIPAIRELIGEGHSINVTLIFGLERYAEVMEAYISGLERLAASGATDLSGVASVASFFVSRVDTEVDRRLDALAGAGGGSAAAGRGGGDGGILALRGTAAVAQAQAAYRTFLETFAGPRWEALQTRGARVQRPLWASTSTKNPAYPDLLYVDTLIGPRTVNTMPEATLHALMDHGEVRRTVDADPEGAEAALRRLEEAGIDFADVGQTLEDEGVASFEKSFDELVQTLSDKAARLTGDDGTRG